MIDYRQRHSTQKLIFTRQLLIPLNSFWSSEIPQISGPYTDICWGSRNGYELTEAPQRLEHSST